MAWTTVEQKREWERKYRARPEVKAVLAKRDRRYRQQLKAETIAAYGQVCACCGEGTLAFLALDHINGGGNQERKKIRVSSGASFYHFLKRLGFPKDHDLQVLCHNCNMGKWVNRGICPHKAEASG